MPLPTSRKRLQEDDERKLPRTRWPIPRHDTITLQKPNERTSERKSECE